VKIQIQIQEQPGFRLATAITGRRSPVADRRSPVAGRRSPVEWQEKQGTRAFCFSISFFIIFVIFFVKGSAGFEIYPKEATHQMRTVYQTFLFNSVSKYPE
jgi:hypothetical protein